ALLRSTLFPYTTLFRSEEVGVLLPAGERRPAATVLRPLLEGGRDRRPGVAQGAAGGPRPLLRRRVPLGGRVAAGADAIPAALPRSEEHTSELQSPYDLV